MSETKKLYTIGVKLDSKESYDRLMCEHSEPGMFSGIDFKSNFRGYPDGYPCLLQYVVDSDPVGFLYGRQLKRMIDDGYLIQLQLEEGA